MCRRAERGGQRRFTDSSGFTLIEALVAFTVMATVLGALYRGVVQTLRAGANVFAARTREEVIARSLLVEFSARRNLRDGSYAGTRDDRRWTLKASLMDLTAQLPKGDKALGADKAASAPPNAAPGVSPNAADPLKGKSEPPKPVWKAQRLVLRVATGARPLETETVHLVKLPPPPDEGKR